VNRQLHFEALGRFRPGIINDLLVRSYRELLDSTPEYWQPEAARWQEFDREAFANPATVGACAFVTCLEAEPIGLGSFEPRDAVSGWVGHNCIVPEHRRQGLGRAQLDHIIRLMTSRGIREIRVTTGTQPFFLPARRMYEARGFTETGCRPGRPDPAYELVDYLLRMTAERIGPCPA
jgi:GNAT superfamily N-acetyltransferase